MVYKNYRLTLIAILILIIASTFLGAYFFFIRENIRIGSLIMISVIVEVVWLNNYINSLNRKISGFFNAILNNETSINLPEYTSNKLIREISNNMNKAISFFRNQKMESEYREKLLQAMIENSATGFLSINEHGNFELMNDVARKFLGIEYTTNLDIVKSNLPELHYALTNCPTGQSRIVNVTFDNKEATLQVSKSEIIYKEKKLILISLLNIRKEIEEKEIESWQKLIRVMNHEIMNSIAPITSVSKSLGRHFLKEGSPIDKKDVTDKIISDTVNGLDIIENMSSGLSHFVDHYRKLSKIPKPTYKEIKVEEWITGFETMFKEQLKENDINLSIDVSKGPIVCFADISLMNQVILNIIKNAIEALTGLENGTIAIKTEPIKANNIAISITDNGKGMNKDELSNIFIPFYTTKENGAGIGLFLSKQIVHMHEGRIFVRSVKDKSTTFRIEI